MSTVKALDRMTRLEAVRLWLAGEWRTPNEVREGEYVMHPADETFFCFWWNCQITEIEPYYELAWTEWHIPTNTKGMLRVIPYDKWTRGQ